MNTPNDDDMPDEIDFTKGERGKFHRSNVSANLPAEREEQTSEPPAQTPGTDNPAFGMWRDREDMADVAAYIRRIRAPRFKRDGSRNKT